MKTYSLSETKLSSENEQINSNSVQQVLYENDGVRQCTCCDRHLPFSKFGAKSWKNKDGTTTRTKKSQCRDCINKSNLKRYHTRPKTKEAHRQAAYRYMIKSYGMSLSDYENMAWDQQGYCYVCKSRPETKRLNIDHDHKTGKVRRLICDPCNQALGHVKDSVEHLKLLIDYLEEHQ